MDLDLQYSLVFGVDLLTYIFLKEQEPETEKEKQNEVVKGRQIWGGLLSFFAILPLRSIFSIFTSSPTLKLCYLSKVVRLYHGFAFLDYKGFTK